MSDKYKQAWQGVIATKLGIMHLPSCQAGNGVRRPCQCRIGIEIVHSAGLAEMLDAERYRAVTKDTP